MVGVRAFIQAYEGAAARRNEIEADLTARLTKVFARQRRKVQARLKAVRSTQVVAVPMRQGAPPPRPDPNAPTPMLRASELAMEGFEDDLETEMGHAYAHHAAWIGAALIGPALFGTVARGLNPRVHAHLSAQVGRLGYVTEGTQLSVESALADAYQNQLEFAALGEVLAHVFDALTDTSAGRIARIETRTLLGGAATSAARVADIPAQKTWNTMQDDRVRQAHEDTEGQIVPLDEPFDVDGVEMDFPGDPSAPIDLTANCRCWLTFTSEENDPDDPESIDPGEFDDTTNLYDDAFALRQAPSQTAAAPGLSSRESYDWNEEDHPRDERGRFGPGGGPSPESPPKGWQAISVDQLQAEGEQRLRDVGMNQVLNELQQAGTLTEALGGETWRSETAEITFDRWARISPEHKREVAETVEALTAADPLPEGANVSIRVLSSAEMSGEFGTSVGRHIQLSDSLFSARADEGPGDLLLAQRFAPTFRDHGLAEYTITHEYGHTLDAARQWAGQGGVTKEVADWMERLPPVSEYGDHMKTNNLEAYAEAYAEYHLSGGKTEAPLAQKLAELEHWSKPSVRGSVTFYNEDQERDEQGRWSGGGSVVERAIDKAVAEMGEPSAWEGGTLERIRQMPEKEAVGRALILWRASFIYSSNMRAMSQGKEPAPGVKNDYYMRTMTHVLVDAVHDAPPREVTYRSMPGGLKEGDTYDQGLMAVALTRSGALEYKQSDIFGDQKLYEVRGAPTVTMEHLDEDVPKSDYTDNRPSPEGITFGRFEYEGDEGDVGILVWKDFGSRTASGATFYREDQERDERGRWAGDGGGLGDGNTPEAREGAEALDRKLTEQEASVRLEMREEGEALLGSTPRTPNEAEDLAETFKATVAADLSQRMDSDTKSLVTAAAHVDDPYGAQQLTGALGDHEAFIAQPNYDRGAMPEVMGVVSAESAAMIDRGDMPPGWNYREVYRGDDPRAEELVREGATSALVHQWAATANDQDAQALALQEVAAREFGLTRTVGWDADPLIASRMDGLLHQHEPVYRDFLRSQYEATQHNLQQAGIKELVVARGFRFARDEDDYLSGLPVLPEWGQSEGVHEIPLRPMSSWSMDPGVAAEFADPLGGRVVYARVPAERVLSHPGTGQGALAEREVVVLGGTLPAVVRDLTRPRESASAQSLVAAAEAPRNDDFNEDWLRQTGWDLPTTVAELRALGIDPLRLLELPVAESMPPQLRAEIQGLQASAFLVHLGVRPSELAQLHPQDVRWLTEQFEYDPEQERDEKGRWTKDGGGAADSEQWRAEGLDATEFINAYHNDLAWQGGGEENVQAFAERNGMTLDEYVARSDERIERILGEHQLVIRASPDTVPLILEEGHFENQFESGTSNGWIDETHSLRRDAEEEMFGIDRYADADERPVYGYLRDPDPHVRDGATQYGAFMFVLKDETRERTTWTSKDSLGPDGNPELTVGDLGSPSIDGFDLAYPPDFLDWQGQPQAGSYLEAQVHGGVRLSDVAGVYQEEYDLPGIEAAARIADFYREKPPSQFTSEERAVEFVGALEGLERAGIPWYAMQGGEWKQGHLPRAA